MLRDMTATSIVRLVIVIFFVISLALFFIPALFGAGR
jgi:hypothetical protein